MSTWKADTNSKKTNEETRKKAGEGKNGDKHQGEPHPMARQGRLDSNRDTTEDTQRQGGHSINSKADTLQEALRTYITVTYLSYLLGRHEQQL